MSQLYRKFSFDKRTRQCPARQAYGLKYAQWPRSLKSQFAKYKEWRTSDFNLDRPYRFRQREATFEKAILEFECFFGFLVNTHKHDPATLRLADVCNPDLVTAYVQWHARTHDGLSRFIQKSVSLFYTVARYYLRVHADQWAKLQDVKAAIRPDKAKTRSKRAKWNSLADLEAIGKAEYPSKREQHRAKTDHQKKLLAVRVQRSLIIRLLTRRPLRSRNIREICLGENLYQDKKANWIIEFAGDQMKVEERRGRENIYCISFPADLVSLLEEWLNEWRPLLNTELPNVFVSKSGRPLLQTTLNNEFKKTVYAYTRKATNIHTIRDIWATEYISTTRDIVGAAQMLGDTVETVLRRYTHLLTASAAESADKFLKEALKQPGRKS